MAEADRKAEGCPSTARGSLVGECLVSVLDDLEAEASLNAEGRKKVLAAFETAFSEELSRVPRFWHLSVKGTMNQFHLGGQERLFDVTEAFVHTPVASWDNLPLRISGTLQPDACKRRRRNIALAT